MSRVCAKRSRGALDRLARMPFPTSLFSTLFPRRGHIRCQWPFLWDIDNNGLECYLPGQLVPQMLIPKDVVELLPGGIRLDTRTGEVYRNGSKIILPEQLFRLLILLGEHPGEVVTREEIRKSLWSETFVNFDDSINSAIRRLRHYLEDAVDSPQLIETLPGHGYRFIVPKNDRTNFRRLAKTAICRLNLAWPLCHLIICPAIPPRNAWRTA